MSLYWPVLVPSYEAEEGEEKVRKVAYLEGVSLCGEIVFKLRNKAIRLDMNSGDWPRFSMHLVMLGLKGLRGL